jgi:hypothetical protein
MKGYISRSELLSLEEVFWRRGDAHTLNLDFYSAHETIEEALYKRNPRYFAKYGGE